MVRLVVSNLPKTNNILNVSSSSLRESANLCAGDIDKRLFSSGHPDLPMNLSGQHLFFLGCPSFLLVLFLFLCLTW